MGTNHFDTSRTSQTLLGVSGIATTTRLGMTSIGGTSR